MISLKFQDAAFQRDFGAIVVKTKNPRSILLNAGREVGNQLRKHFRQRDGDSPNHISSRRSHFWLDVAQSVNVPQLEGQFSVSVTVSDPRFVQKVFGGPIRPKDKEALSIPVDERAYDRTPATFEAETGLKLILVKIGGSKANALENAVLAVADPLNPGHLTTEYLLTKGVDQQADTEALPEKNALETAIIARSQRVLDRELETPTGPDVIEA